MLFLKAMVVAYVVGSRVCLAAPDFKMGEPLWNVDFSAWEDGTFEMQLHEVNYAVQFGDGEYRSEKKTDCRIQMVDKAGLILDSTFCNLVEVHSLAGSSGSSKGKRSLETHKIGEMNFRREPKAYKIELFWKQKLRAVVLISRAQKI